MAPSEERIRLLQAAIRNLHECESRYIGTEIVTETFEGNKIWEGAVEVFELINHPKAKRCFAWSYTDEKPTPQNRHIIVLEVSPVRSAQDAVRVAIVSDAKTWPN